MHTHVAEGLTEEQLALYERIQRVIYPYVVGSLGNRELSALSSDLDELVTSLVESRPEAIPEGYELRWTITDDILGVPAPELVKVVDVDEMNQGVLPLHREDAA